MCWSSLRHGLRSGPIMKPSPGSFGQGMPQTCIGAGRTDTSAQPLKGTFRSLSAWTDEQALASFARTDPHAAALNRIRPWTKSSTFRFWSVPVGELTAGTFSPAGLWADGMARVAAAEPDGGSPATPPREP